jgi:hypothetical protein
MRDAETTLLIIEDRGKKNLPLENVYRRLYNPDLYLRAYGRLYRNEGAMTKGTTGETVDGMSRRKIEECRLQAEWAPLWETSGYHLSGCGADCSTTLGIKAVRRLDSRPLRDCRADQGRIDSLSGPGPMFR